MYSEQSQSALLQLHLHFDTWDLSQNINPPPPPHPRCGNFHHKDKTVIRAPYLYNGNPYTGKTTFLYWGVPDCTSKYFQFCLHSPAPALYIYVIACLQGHDDLPIYPSLFPVYIAAISPSSMLQSSNSSSDDPWVSYFPPEITNGPPLSSQ